MEFTKRLGKTLKKQRKYLNMKVVEVGIQSGVGYRSVYRMEEGDNTAFLLKLLSVSRTLKKPLWKFIKEAEETE